MISQAKNGLGFSDLVTKLCSFILLCLGVIVVAGWISRTATLIQIQPQFAPMQVNTALGFILGAALPWADYTRRPKVLRLVAITLCLLSGLTLIQYLLDINLGIDELLFDHYLDVKTSHPGRMAPNTALCFLLFGALGWIRANNKGSALHIQGLLAAIPMGLALVTLTGYGVHIETTYGWGNLTRMAIHTAAGFTTLSIGMLIQFRSDGGSANEEKKACWWIAPAAIAIATMSVSLAVSLNQHYNEQLSNFTSYLEWVVLVTGTILIATLYGISHITSRRLYTTIKTQIYASYMLFAAGTLGTLGFYAWLHSNFETDIENRFVQEVEDSQKGLIAGLKGYENTLLEVRDDVELAHPINDEKFRAILKGEIQRSDQDVIFIWAPKIADENRELYEQRLATLKQSHAVDSPNGIADLAIDDFTTVLSPPRPFYLPATHSIINIVDSSTWIKDLFSDPRLLEQSILGLDWATLSNSLPTIAKAIARDGAAAAPLTVANRHLDAIEIILPTYNRSLDIGSAENSFSALDGVLIAILSMDRVFSDLVETINPKGVGFQLSKGNFHILEGVPDDFDPNKNRLQQTNTVELLGSDWELTTYAIDNQIYPAWSVSNLAPAVILWFYIWFGAIYFWRQSIQHVQQRSHDAYLTALVEAIPTPVYVHDQRQKVLLENEAVRQQIPTVVLKQLITESTLSSASSREVVLKDTENTDRLYIQKCVDFLLPNGRQGTIGILTDITELKQAEQAAKFAAEYADMIFQKSPVAMLICDDNGIIIKSNHAFQRLLASDNEALANKPVEHYVPTSTRAIENLLSSNSDSSHYRSDTDQSESTALTAVTDEGHHFPIDMDVSRLRSGDSQHIIVSIKDMTDNLNKQTQLLLAKQEADAANRAKTDFLATISHEIRTPMNAIIGMTTLALDTQLTLKQKDYLDKVSLAAKSLLRLINDILDYSKIEADRLELENEVYDLQREVIDYVANTVSVKAARKKIELIFDIPSDMPQRIYGDSLRVSQVLINLLDNAIKFTDKGLVKLKIETLNVRGEIYTLKFSIIDSGIGMNPDQLKNVFTKFSQADTTITRRFGGTGLGLSICKSLVELMGGRIHINSEQGVGSTFEFTLDLKSEVHRNHSKNNHIEADSPTYKRALIVDDSAISRSIISRYLDSFNIENDESESGESCLIKVKQANITAPYDLIFIDWKMPNMDGLETISSLKNICDKPPKIVMMTSADSHDLEPLVSSDINIIYKPISPSTLLDTLNSGTIPLRLESNDNASTNNRVHYQNVKVLLVEDNKLNQQVAQEFLLAMGIESVIANHGEEALELIESNAFDAVLMDMQMPVMDGLTATQLIRKNAKYDDTPIIAMTANAAESDRKRCLEAGMNDHIGKPILPELLKSTLATWLKAQPTVIEEDENSEKRTQTKLMSNLDTIEGLNTQDGLNYLDNNESFYHNMLNRFCEEHQNTHQELTSLMGEGDFETAERIAHTLKGLARGLGAATISDLAKDIEQCASNKHIAKESLDKIKGELDTVIGGITNLSSDLVESKDQISPTLDNRSFQEKVLSIVQGIRDWDASTVDGLKELLQYSLPISTEKALSEVLAPIESYDFEQAAHHIKNLESLTIENSLT